VEAEKCWELKGPAQGRRKQKGRWVESQRKGDYLGRFFIPSLFCYYCYTGYKYRYGRGEL